MAAKKKPVVLHYKNHSKRRIVRDFVWESSNDWTCTIDDPDLVQILLRDPSFEIVAEVETPVNVTE